MGIRGCSLRSHVPKEHKDIKHKDKKKQQDKRTKRQKDKTNKGKKRTRDQGTKKQKRKIARSLNIIEVCSLHLRDTYNLTVPCKARGRGFFRRAYLSIYI